MTDDHRILVLGATGMLGHTAVRVLADRFDVHGTARDTKRAADLGVGGTLHPFDAWSPEALRPLLREIRPQAVINCVGVVKQLDAANDPVHAITLNALFPHQVARICADEEVRLVHISTDCVFSGALPAPERYTEDHVPDARDLYGRSKLLGEVSDAGAVTLRTSIIGWELGRQTGLLEWFASQAGRTVQGYTNAVFSGLTTAALSHVIAEVLRDHPQLYGLWHVSADPISKYDLLSAFNRELDLGCTIEPVASPRINRALDSSAFRSRTGIDIPTWSTMIHEQAREPR